MAKKKDYIPKGIASFFGWQFNLVTKVVAGAAGWNIAAGKVTILTDAQTVYLPFYNAIANPATKTKGAIAQHEAERKIYIKVIRAFVKESLINNSAITVQEKIDMGLNPGGDHAPRPKIDTAPNVQLTAMGGLQVQLEFRVENDASRPSIHQDSDGLELRLVTGPPAPTKLSDMKQVVFSTKAKFKHLFEEEDIEGKTLYLYARWKNNSDDKKSGPWSKLASVVIR